MCSPMAEIVQKQQIVPQNLGKRLAVAVRSIQWSYAIFWSLSTSQQGVLEWCGGYYNGDIKTRKSVQAVELRADKIGLQRSEQLRELYESLQEGETDPAKGPSAALSPEDLSDAEWYYLVCMSFVFNPGQGLPGRSFANGETIWLCNAQYADSKVFSRSLLAKSASIQTVVCFPYLGGVVELGVTEMVPEDPNLLQHIKTSLLDVSKPFCMRKSPSSPNHSDDDKGPMSAKVDPEVMDLLDVENSCSPTEEMRFDQEGIIKVPVNIGEEFDIDSSDECSLGFENDKETEDSFVLGMVNAGYSRDQSWQLMDDDLSNGIPHPANPSDCISEAIVNQEGACIFPTKCGSLSNRQIEEVQEFNHTKLSYLDLGADNYWHFMKTLSVILESSTCLEGPRFNFPGYKSSFVSWKKGESAQCQRPRVQQNILRKILFTVPLMHSGRSLRSQKEIGEKSHCLGKLENGHSGIENAPLDNKIESDKYQVLGSMVPSACKIDKASLIDDTIKYLKELEARIEELESCMGLVGHESRPRRNYLDMVEETSDNNESRKVDNGKKQWINKRKASEINESRETDTEINLILPKEGLTPDLEVSIKGQEVLIKMRCPYREYILLDIMDAINNLHLDALTVQSSTLDGIVSLTLNSKFRGSAIARAGMIKRALWEVAGRC